MHNGSINDQIMDSLETGDVLLYSLPWHAKGPVSWTDFALRLPRFVFLSGSPYSHNSNKNFQVSSFRNPISLSHLVPPHAQMDTLIDFLCNRSSDNDGFNHCAVVVENELHKPPQILEWTPFGPRVRDYDEHFVVSPANTIYLRRAVTEQSEPIDLDGLEDRASLCRQHCAQISAPSAVASCVSSLWDACQGTDPAVKCVVDLWLGIGLLPPLESDHHMHGIAMEVWFCFLFCE